MRKTLSFLGFLAIAAGCSNGSQPATLIPPGPADPGGPSQDMLGSATSSPIPTGAGGQGTTVTKAPVCSPSGRHRLHRRLRLLHVRVQQQRLRRPRLRPLGSLCDTASCCTTSPTPARARSAASPPAAPAPPAPTAAAAPPTATSRSAGSDDGGRRSRWGTLKGSPKPPDRAASSLRGSPQTPPDLAQSLIYKITGHDSRTAGASPLFRRPHPPTPLSLARPVLLHRARCRGCRSRERGLGAAEAPPLLLPPLSLPRPFRKDLAENPGPGQGERAGA